MRIAITGGTGGLGGQTGALARARGHDVVATGRNLETGAQLAQQGITFIAGDITDRAVLERAFRGADVVIHSAALSSPWGTHSAFHHTNVEGTQAVVEAVTTQGVARLVHISTASVYARYRDQLGLREDDILPVPVNSYAATKLQAERLIEASGVPYIILRPRAIFGPTDTVLLPRLLRAASSRPMPLMRGGAALTDLTYIDNAAEAVLAAAAAPAAAFNTVYNISNGEPIRVRDLIERILRGTGGAVRWCPVPIWAAMAGARLAEGVCARLPGRPEPIATAYSLGLLAYSQTLDISKAKAHLGWKPQTSLVEGLRRTIAAWSKVEGGP